MPVAYAMGSDRTRNLPNPEKTIHYQPRLQGWLVNNVSSWNITVRFSGGMFLGVIFDLVQDFREGKKPVPGLWKDYQGWAAKILIHLSIGAPSTGWRQANWYI